MTPRLHIVRHAEAIHNIAHEKTLPDPELAAEGIQQARTLRQTFPYKQDVGLIITSRLRRAIQTTLEGFRDVLNQQYSEDGMPNGARLLIDPEVQAHSARPL